MLDNHLLRTFSLLFSSFSARKKKQRGRKSPERTLPCPSLLKRLLNMIGAYDQLSLSLPSNVYLPVVRAVVRKMYVCARDDNVRRYSREQIECFLLGTRLPFRFSLPITRARFSLRTRVQHNTKTKSSNDANEEQRSRCTSARGFLYLPLWGCTFHLSVNPPLPPAPCLVLSLGLVPLSLSLFSSFPPLSPLSLPPCLAQARRTKQCPSASMSLSRRFPFGCPTHARLVTWAYVYVCVCILAPTSAPPHQARLSPCGCVSATKATSPETGKKRQRNPSSSSSSSSFS